MEEACCLFLLAGPHPASRRHPYPPPAYYPSYSSFFALRLMRGLRSFWWRRRCETVGKMVFDTSALPAADMARTRLTEG